MYRAYPMQQHLEASRALNDTDDLLDKYSQTSISNSNTTVSEKVTSQNINQND